MNSNAPYSEQFRLAGIRWADLDAAARMLEEGKTTYLAQRKTALGDVADNKAEREVKSAPDWSDYIKKMVRAKTEANKAKIELEYMRMKFSEWQSEAANARAERRL